MKYNETLYGKQYLLGTDVYEDGKHKILNVPLIDLMYRNGFIPEGKYNEIYNLSVVWYEVDAGGSNDVCGIILSGSSSGSTDNGNTITAPVDSGETYWTDKPANEWTDNDEELLNALLMYGNLENTIGDLYV